MGYLSFMRDERVAALGLGLAALGCIAAMRAILEHCRDEAEVKPTQPTTRYITQDTEDSLKLSTLRSLLRHPSYAIRDTAVRIVTGRALSDDDAVNDLLWGITRESYDERTENLRALIYALEDNLSGTYQESLIMALNTPKAYSAIVRSLELCLGDVEHDKLNDAFYDEYYFRDIGERQCLALVSQLAHKYGMEKFVQAKFVERWLIKQPWGEADDERRDNFQQYVERRKNRLADICRNLISSKAGRKALSRAKLMHKLRKPKSSRPKNVKVVLEISMANDSDGDAVLLETSTDLVPRVNEQSAEEQRLRRRHREAMVLNDGTHSLGRGDIIEREHDSNS
ncbi:hypothetical protein F5Y18DRAFT_396091 [Xylariaceae sp. FL1019]|nr:hypothetical protein F5Y18DRAFT_396091 [Xylariaceae sp. FL1019]